MQTENKATNKTFDEIYATFGIGGIEVALNVADVQEVVNFPENVIKMPLSPSFLVGVFNLRGLIIPIINLKQLLHLEGQEVQPNNKIAIVDHEGAKIGLIFDSTSEIVRIKKEYVDLFSYVEEKSHKVIKGALKLENGERIIQILNPFALFHIENIPQITDQQQRIKKDKLAYRQDGRKKCISFSINDMTMGFEISGINEIIKIDSIESSTVQSELCLGIINLRGQVIPIIDSGSLFSGTPSDQNQLQEKRVIILRLEQEHFGLLVDSVENIVPYTVDAIMAIPVLNSERSGMFQGCIQTPDHKEIILLSHQNLLSNQEVLSITQGHSKIYQSEKQTQIRRGGINRNSYISFRLDHMFAVSIYDVREIINDSAEIISAPGTNDIVKGILNLRGKLVTIINTRNLYQLPQLENNPDSKILIFDHGEERFGFVVDSIESIVMVDNEKKMRVPSIMVQNVREKFQNDIKEIVTVNQNEKESAIIILNMEPVINRIKCA